MTDASEIRDARCLGEIYGRPSRLAAVKCIDRLEKHCRNFIALSPFLCLATADAEGRLDVSPRGDAPGFVEVLDDKRLLIPDRRGNNRVDSLTNIVENPRVGLIFMIPGVEETLRVNGSARIVRDPAVLAPLAAQGKVPRSALEVTVEEVMFQCSKALRRSRLWNDDYRIERSVLPTLGQMITDQVADGSSAEEAEAMVQKSLRTKLY